MTPLSQWSAASREPGAPHVGDVRLVDLDIPFWRLVRFMVTWALAAIPAALILWLAVALMAVVIPILVAGIVRGLGR